MRSIPAPHYINVLQWHQSLGFARQACARIFRDGGSPRGALEAFGLGAPAGASWSQAVELIAESLCSRSQKMAA